MLSSAKAIPLRLKPQSKKHMAKVNFGPLANDARGKINGIVYSKNKSGAYTRKKVTPANPNSPSQSTVRTNFGMLSQAWSGTISGSDRAAWISYAATYPRLDVFGASIQLSGLNMFISLNQVLLQLGVAYASTPPASNVVTPIPYDPTTYSVTAATSDIHLSQTAAAGSADLHYYVFASKPLPPGRTVQRNNFRFIGSQAGSAGPYPANVALGPLYTAKFGSWVAGQNIAILLATVDITTGLTTVGAILQTVSS